MNTAIVGLAFAAAINPKFLVIDLILAGNQRPRPMFVCFLLGGMGLALTVGLLDVLVLRAHLIGVQGSASAGLDLALGVPLLAVGALLAANRLHLHWRRLHASAAHGLRSKLEGWVHRVLHEPRFGLAVLIGALCGTPGASYILALHKLVTGNSSTTAQVIAVIIFVTIQFGFVIVPFGFVAASPAGAERVIRRFEGWLSSHERQIAAAVALIAGGYMAVSGLVRLLN